MTTNGRFVLLVDVRGADQVVLTGRSAQHNAQTRRLTVTQLTSDHIDKSIAELLNVVDAKHTKNIITGFLDLISQYYSFFGGLVEMIPFKKGKC